MAIDALQAIMLKVKNEQDAVRFVDQVLTQHEQVVIGRRILIAQMILAGMKQAEINEKLNASPNTLSKIRQWLKGTLPEYEEVCKEYEKATKNRTRSRLHGRRQYQHFTFASLKERYPMHFLLFNILDKLLER